MLSFRSRIPSVEFSYYQVQFSMACLMLFARRLPTTIFSQLTVSEALRLLGQTFIAINTKFFPAVVRPANLSRISPEPSWSLEGTWATFATSNTRVFRLDWLTLALGTCGSSIQFSKSKYSENIDSSCQ